MTVHTLYKQMVSQPCEFVCLKGQNVYVKGQSKSTVWCQKEFTQTNHTIFCNVMYAYVCKICEEK